MACEYASYNDHFVRFGLTFRFFERARLWFAFHDLAGITNNCYEASRDFSSTGRNSGQG